MPLFRVTYDASLVVEVVAESFEEAEDLARPIADKAEAKMEAMLEVICGDDAPLVVVGSVYSARNLDTDEELLH